MRKVLNLYAGLGGNRKLWSDVCVTAVEFNPDIAKVYADLYPQDILIVGDAHSYLAEHYAEFDFIWTSPPCQSHSSFRQNIGVRFRGVEPVYPDMRLYQEILFLRANCKARFLVENVNPYYSPLIDPTARIHRHLFWANFEIPESGIEGAKIRTAQIPDLQQLHGIDLSGYSISNKRQLLRNCVYPPLGEYIFQQARRGWHIGGRPP